jgi:hypothetical protein
MTSVSGGGGLSGPGAGASSVTQPANNARPAAIDTSFVEISFFIDNVFLP